MIRMYNDLCKPRRIRVIYDRSNSDKFAANLTFELIVKRAIGERPKVVRDIIPTRWLERPELIAIGKVNTGDVHRTGSSMVL